MKPLLICALILCSQLAKAQIVFQPGGPLPKKEKSDADKISLGVSSQLVLFQVYFPYRVLFSLNVYKKNIALNLGPVIHINLFKNANLPDVTIKRYGYNLAFRYIFPQNKRIAKAYIPLEFTHVLVLKDKSSYFDHVSASSGPGGMPNPGYSFSLNTKSNTNTFSVKTGFGLYIWLHKRFNVELQVAFGTNFSQDKTDYYNSDTGNLLNSQRTALSPEKYLLGELSFGFGYRF